MKKIFASLAILGFLAAFASGCAYSSVAMHGDRAVVLENTWILFFPVAPRAYVCQVTDEGLSQCHSHENP